MLAITLAAANTKVSSVPALGKEQFESRRAVLEEIIQRGHAGYMVALESDKAKGIKHWPLQVQRSSDAIHELVSRQQRLRSTSS